MYLKIYESKQVQNIKTITKVCADFQTLEYSVLSSQQQAKQYKFNRIFDQFTENQYIFDELQSVLNSAINIFIGPECKYRYALFIYFVNKYIEQLNVLSEEFDQQATTAQQNQQIIQQTYNQHSNINTNNENVFLQLTNQNYSINIVSYNNQAKQIYNPPIINSQVEIQMTVTNKLVNSITTFYYGPSFEQLQNRQFYFIFTKPHSNNQEFIQTAKQHQLLRQIFNSNVIQQTNFISCMINNCENQSYLQFCVQFQNGLLKLQNCQKLGISPRQYDSNSVLSSYTNNICDSSNTQSQLRQMLQQYKKQIVTLEKDAFTFKRQFESERMLRNQQNNLNQGIILNLKNENNSLKEQIIILKHLNSDYERRISNLHCTTNNCSINNNQYISQVQKCTNFQQDEFAVDEYLQQQKQFQQIDQKLKSIVNCDIQNKILQQKNQKQMLQSQLQQEDNKQKMQQRKRIEDE